jgi:hypothetical protein
MSNGNEVRKIDELRENFDLEKITEYYLEGKLITWLQHRNYIEELSQIEKLQFCDNKNEIPSMLCKIFNVKQLSDLDVFEIEQRKNKISILNSFSDNEEWEKKLEFIAFTQEELEEKLSVGSLCNILEGNIGLQRREVYLCGEIFTISDEFKDITYVGVNTPFVNIISNNVFDAKANNIKFENVKITSETMIEAVITESDNCTINDNKVLIRKMWGKTPTIIDGLNFNKILVYKNMLICADIGKYDEDVFRIIDINDGSVLKKLSDLKTVFLGKSLIGFYSLQIGVYAMTIYKDTLVCFCGEWPGKNGIIIYINLETLEISKSYKVPEGYDGNRYIYKPDEIGVDDGKISLYQKGTLGIKCQYHDYNTGECLSTSSIEALDNSSYSDGRGYSQIYKGSIYFFSPKKKKMTTDDKQYIFKGFKKQNNNKVITNCSNSARSIGSLLGTMASSNNSNDIVGEIGAFAMFDDKIVTAGCYIYKLTESRLTHDSVVQDGYIAVYDITGGDLIKTLKVSDSAIRVIKYYKGVLIIVLEDGKIKILDAKSLDIINTLILVENIKNNTNDPLQHSLKALSNIWLKEFEVYVDHNSDKMAVLFDRKVHLYE